MICDNGAVDVEADAEGEPRVAAGVQGDDDGAVDGSERSMERSAGDGASMSASRRYSETTVDEVDFVGDETYESGKAPTTSSTTGECLMMSATACGVPAPRRAILAIKDSYFVFHASRSETSEVMVCCSV